MSTRRRAGSLATRIASATVLALSFAACGKASTQSGFVMAADPGSRYGFEVVRDRASGKWVHLHCELRVALARALPEAVPPDDVPLHFTRFVSGAMGTAGIAPGAFEVRDDHRVWLYRGVGDDGDLAGTTSIGVQAVWPDTTPVRHEPMEVLAIPALRSMRPYVWSAWMPAKETRAGQFAEWEKANDRESGATPAPEYPFEMRCRAVLSDVTFVPSPEKDANIAMPAPGSAAR